MGCSDALILAVKLILYPNGVTPCTWRDIRESIGINVLIVTRDSMQQTLSNSISRQSTQDYWAFTVLLVKKSLKMSISWNLTWNRKAAVQLKMFSPLFIIFKSCSSHVDGIALMESRIATAENIQFSFKRNYLRDYLKK